jgi:N-acetylglucosamine-6-phosphate deacetylase
VERLPVAERTGVTVLSGASLILPDRVVSGLSLVVDGERIAELRSGPRPVGGGDRHVDVSGCFVAPGFIDVHVHGVLGTDVLDSADAVDRVARTLPRWGVTAFCPTATAAPPDVLSRLLASVGARRLAPEPGAARVLPAHLESSFINPEYRGAQPLACLRSPAAVAGRTSDPAAAAFSARDVVATIDRHRSDAGIVTLAPELDGAVELIRSFVAAGIRVSLGHTGATYDEAQAGITAGATHATHLFNRMRPMSHREPGVAGAVLTHDSVAVEVICDGVHVHRAIVRLVVAAKGRTSVMAITDATAGAALPAGSRATLGGQPIVVSDTARLEDGTLAGSVTTMDRAFAWLVTACGLDLVEASALCSTTPARRMGLVGFGAIAPGAVADLVVLDRDLRVVSTWIGGKPVGGRRA